MKTISLLLLFILNSVQVIAQTENQNQPSPTETRRTRFGIHGGINLATIHPDLQDEPKFSMHAGIFSEQRLSNNVAFQMEWNYSKQGSSEAATYQEFRLNYLQMPLLLNGFASENVVLEGGVYGAYLLSATLNQKYISSQTNQFVNDKSNVYDYFDPFDLGFCLGLKYNSFQGMQFGVRYNYGVANINEKISIKGTTEIPDMYNRVVQFTVGFRF